MIINGHYEFSFQNLLESIAIHIGQPAINLQAGELRTSFGIVNSSK